MASQIFIPNDEQQECLKLLSTFITANKPHSKLLINGSAGTGKTTLIIKTIIEIITAKAIPCLRSLAALNPNEFEQLMTTFPSFIISAPTNKAKDVLLHKYNNYISSPALDIKDSQNYKSELIKILSSCIQFLTVSQVLSIKRQINELGEEEFTKGNDKKVAAKYSKPIYNNSFIIVDECSMIETNSTKLLALIKCPIIYIGDYCQLPPVSEALSETFKLEHDGENQFVVNLKKVERCKNGITDIANQLRDKIYGTVEHFNLINHSKTKVPELIIYNKKFSKWLEAYIADIKAKYSLLTTNPSTTAQSTTSPSQPINDTMALGWTNKCCSYLNKKVRDMLFKIDSNDIFLIDGDKLLIKTPYYGYNNKIYSSSIVYVSRHTTANYKPYSFREWCNVILDKNKHIEVFQDINPEFEIDLDAILSSQTSSSPTNSKKTKDTNTKNPTKSITDYFDKADEPLTDSLATPTVARRTGVLDLEKDKESLKTLIHNRRKFGVYHNFIDHYGLINQESFKDEYSKKYAAELEPIVKTINQQERDSQYSKWHQKTSTRLFGAPIDNFYCKKCRFFVKIFSPEFKTSEHIQDFADATENINLELYITSLVAFNMAGNSNMTDIPIINSTNEKNNYYLDTMKSIIKNSFEIKKKLSKHDQRELNAINKELEEEDDSTSSVALSQMLGHYLSHIMKSVYTEVDYGYALTVHKSQGSTYDDVYVEYSNLVSNRKEEEKNKLLYTAITRCANKLHVYA